jgi:uncharacterized membrane protein YkoI
MGVSSARSSVVLISPEDLRDAPRERSTVMAIKLSKRASLFAAGAAVVVLGATGTAIAVGGDDDDANDRAITGSALQKATDAALAETGGGRVTDTEVDDEQSKYEVEVTLDDGTQVDVQLDESFQVTGSETDGPGDEDD